MGVDKLIMKEPPERYGALAWYPWTRELADRFTMSSRFGDPIVLWTQEGKMLGLPRAFCPVGPNDERVDGYPVDFKSKIVARNQEQEDAIAKTVAFLKAGQSGLLGAPTGKGKTVMSIEAAARVGVSTLVIAPKDDLVKQWDERILEHTELKRHEVGRIQQDVCNPFGKVITVASLGSVAKPGRYSDDIWKLFGLVIFDEVHRLGADYFSTACHLSQARLRLGLTATPKRSDGKEVVFLGHIGPMRVKMEKADRTPKVLRYASPWKCPRRRNPQTGLVEVIPHSATKGGHVETMLSKSDARNMMLVYFMKHAYDAGRHTVIFSSRTAHFKELERLAVLNGIPRSALGHYYGSMKSEAMKAEGVKPLVFATWGKMAEGTDIPSLDTAILATPRSNVEQAVGRILRKKDGKKESVVFDLVDDDSPVYKGYAKGRNKFYSRIGAKIVEMELQRDNAATP